MENKVTHAPKAVIDELDKLKNIKMIFELFERGSVLDINTFGDSNVVDSWVYVIENELILKRELAVINHVFNNERLKPEREARYYVDYNGMIIGLPQWSGQPMYFDGNIAYENGMTEAQAHGYAELFGGEAKEIK